MIDPQRIIFGAFTPLDGSSRPTSAIASCPCSSAPVPRSSRARDTSPICGPSSGPGFAALVARPSRRDPEPRPALPDVFGIVRLGALRVAVVESNGVPVQGTVPCLSHRQLSPYDTEGGGRVRLFVRSYHGHAAKRASPSSAVARGLPPAAPAAVPWPPVLSYPSPTYGGPPSSHLREEREAGHVLPHFRDDAAGLLPVLVTVRRAAWAARPSETDMRVANKFARRCPMHRNTEAPPHGDDLRPTRRRSAPQAAAAFGVARANGADRRGSAFDGR